MVASVANLLTRTLGLLGVGAALLSHAPAQIAVQATSPVITFEEISRAERSLSLQVKQVRRILEPGRDAQTAPSWVGIREDLTTGLDPQTGEPRFELEFAGFDGQSSTRSDLARRRELYRGYAGYLHLHASLRITDAALAAKNYSIVYLDARQRLGRATHRVVVLPRRLGGNPWVLEVDALTSYPLFRAEFNAVGVLVSTLEVTQFVETAPATDTSWWRPARSVDVYADGSAAIRALAAPEGSANGLILPRTSELPAGYQFLEARIVRDDLRPETSLVLVYTDGIDDLFVVETLNTPPPRLPAPTGGAASYAIFVYQDQNVAQLMFHAKGVQTLVIGRAGQFQLGPLTQSLLRRSLQDR